MGSIAGFFYLHFINLRNTLYSLQGIFLVFLGGVMFYYAKKEDKCYISSERRGLFSFFKSTYLHFFILGLLIGSTPCLALFSILPYIFIHSTNPFIGALLGGTVGLGTLSSFLPLFIIGGVIKSYVRLKIISYLAAIFLIIWGIRLLLLQL
jgi:sulfite exporter TauE/SafE